MLFRFCMLLLLCATSSQALEIRIDYTYDTNNFFDTEEKRDAMEAVAAFYESLIEDEFLAIDASEFSGAAWSLRFTHPTTGVDLEVPGIVIPENVIIVYVGARDLGGSTAGVAGPGGFSASGNLSTFDAWVARIEGRGNSAAAGDTFLRTDFSLWGGAISFDTPRDWNFSLDTNGPGSEFIIIALHEMGHLLGLGTADSWINLIDFDTATFGGPAVIRSNGSAPGLGDIGHFSTQSVSTKFKAFNQTHGESSAVIMIPTRTDFGDNFEVMTDFDLAAMVDIGWELNPDPALRIIPSALSEAVIEWDSVSFKEYTVGTSATPGSFAPVTTPGLGDGSIQSYTDTAPAADLQFYQLTAADPPSATQTVPSAAKREVPRRRVITNSAGESQLLLFHTVEPVEIECAFCEHAE